MGNSERIKKIFCFIMLAAVSMIWMFPVLWAVLTSFKSEYEIQGSGFHLIPKEWTLENYLKLIVDNDSTPVFKWFLN